MGGLWHEELMAGDCACATGTSRGWSAAIPGSLLYSSSGFLRYYHVSAREHEARRVKLSAQDVCREFLLW